MSQKSGEMSEQTVWMLAVRDDRNKSAFAALFDYFAPRLKGMLMRGGLQASLAEEVVQDTMLAVWRKAHLFDPHRAQVSGWVYQIARNRQIDVLRKERRPIPEEMRGDDVQEDDSLQIVALEQDTARLRKALQCLSPEQRTLVEQAYLGDMSHSELHAQTGLPLGTIKSRIRLGLERLRRELGNEQSL
ncbi:sigma-70 family RNA polymerase sigma factor [uncultured Shimia sp.]|uniref:sigma-70 family RNA polymerase sigma factor n=1 Tax=uncultured Shimia sp. TaxID=573152 RepID=UPI0026254CC7|nr:sigma-70 family RNA polymerase sigma factor [uncultured Shimia sp.]